MKIILWNLYTQKYGGRDADLKTYMLAASEIGRYCGATALTFNMHVSSCLWTGYLADNLEMDDEKEMSTTTLEVCIMKEF